jgi:hypothetical protein
MYIAGVFRWMGSEFLVSKVAKVRFAGLVAVLGVAILPVAGGQTQHSPRPHSQGRFARAADITFRDGAHAKLPPHLSTLLGLSKEQECPVMQSVVRAGTHVQGFDVSAANKNDIVLFVVDEKANDQTLYLTSSEGTLRKVVSVKAGVGDEVRMTDEEKTAFKMERQFWVDRLVLSVTGK